MGLRRRDVLNLSCPGSDGARADFSISSRHLRIEYQCGETPAPRTLFIALRSGAGLGSAVLPFAENSEGSTVFLPFQANRLYLVRWEEGTPAIFERTWKDWRWSERREAPNEVTATREGASAVVHIPLTDLSRKVDAVIYAKDFAQEKWGWFFGCSDPLVNAGAGDKYIPHYLEIDLQAKGAPVVKMRGRLGAGEARLRIYQLFVRLFGNVNETRQPNGTLAQNGVGKFNDINDAALAAIQKMGFSHIWLTGVLQQASATDYSEAGQPAADPDLLKGLAGSPYAIADYFDVCADYAAEPKKRLTEFKNLLGRIHAHKMKALIDFIPNHVARCYHSDIQPEINFGTHDDRGKFFDPQNNFFYLPVDADGPPLQLPTWKDGVAISPTCQLAGMKCDGRFEGESKFGRVTGNNVVSWKPSLNDWYETVKLNFGFDFTDPDKNRREYPNARTPEKPVPDTWMKMDRVIGYWQSLGVDGFRCDMAHMQPPEFWKWLIGRARERAPKVVFVGEAYDNDPAKVPGSDPVISRLAYERGNVMFDLLDAGFNGVYDDPTYRVLKGVFEGGRWANDLDTSEREPFIFENSLRYAENHDEVRLAAPSQWGGVGMNVGRPVAAILYGLSRGPLMLYNGQEVGEAAAGAEGFGGDDSRTSIFDYWSMPEMVRWVNGHTYDGANLSAEQKSLRQFYGRLVRLNAEPAFRDGALYPLNPANHDNPCFGRIGDESASGHWCYAFLRYDHTTQQRFLVIANLHPHETFRDLRVLIPAEALRFLALSNPETKLKLRDRLAAEPTELESSTGDLATHGLQIPQLPPLSASYLELSPNEE
jgi:glycosidase